MSCGDLPTNEELLEAVTAWCKLRKAGRFRDWELDEFINETWVAARKLVDDKFDPTKASLTTFLQRFMWDYIFRIYCKQNQIVIIRKRTPAYEPREYREMFPVCADWEEATFEHSEIAEDSDSFDTNKYAELNPRQHDIIQMVCRGMTNTQVGYAFNRSPSWVTLELRKIKDILLNQE